MSEHHVSRSRLHLSPEEIVSYIDRTLAEDARRQVECHFAECEACLREVIEVKGLLRERTP